LKLWYGKWLTQARKLLLEINKLGLPTATEFLEPITTQYIADLVSWWAIWARTTESQTHRHMTSWLSMPVWLKNATSWDINIARDAIISAQNPHNFLWINNEWCMRQIKTKWNLDSHLILRGWKSWPNYSKKDIQEASETLENAGIKTWIIIDASHANSNKDHKRQTIVCENIAKQLEDWNKKIVWIMLESNLNSWKQSFTPWKDDPANLACWVSITDACIDLNETENILEMMENASKNRAKI
jgi:3-deoxy-7-phosphoheptulonate synthase